MAYIDRFTTEEQATILEVAFKTVRAANEGQAMQDALEEELTEQQAQRVSEMIETFGECLDLNEQLHDIISGGAISEFNKVAGI